VICCMCGRTLKRATATSPAGAMGPVCAKKRPAGDLFPVPFDLDRMCADANRKVQQFVAERAREIQQQLRR
jgi:hypothetical protein